MRDLLSAAAMSQDKMLRMPNTGTSASERHASNETFAEMTALRWISSPSISAEGSASA